MEKLQENIRDESIAEIRQACYHFADLYFHFCKMAVQEFGISRGKELVKNTVANRAIERAERMRQIAADRNLPLSIDTWRLISDIPRSGWVQSLGKHHCPYGEAWLARFEENPWFAEFAEMYCNVNDPLVTEHFTGDMTQHITKNVLSGDETCDRVYFPLKSTVKATQME